MKANFKYITKEKERRNQVNETWQIMKMLFILAYYNVVDDSLKTPKKQRQLIQDTVYEVDRLLFEDFKNDEDMLDIAIARFPRIAKELGFDYELKRKPDTSRY